MFFEKFKLKLIEYKNPISYTNINVNEYDSILLPGGHAEGMNTMLESEILQEKISQFFIQKKIIGIHKIINYCYLLLFLSIIYIFIYILYILCYYCEALFIIRWNMSWIVRISQN